MIQRQKRRLVLFLPHRADPPLGQPVTITTRVIGSETRTVDFQFEVRDAHETIARGLHKRAVVTVESFARRVARKSAPN